MNPVKAFAWCIVLCTAGTIASAADKGSSTPPQEGYTFGWNVIASGGAMGVLSTNYIHYGTAGQTVVDACQCSNFVLRSGIWHFLEKPMGITPPGGPTVPSTYALLQNYPNPFNPTTIIRSQLPAAGDVRIVVYDLLGREVAVVVNGRRAAGYYEDSFDARGLASGVYVYRMTAGSFVQSRRMILVR
jgi:hypothetical protein